MAGFSQLPNEMISEIWGNVHEPRDVESFALVSKLVYAIGSPFVEEHNLLKKTYSFVETGNGRRSHAPAFLLRNIVLRPRTALYVTHLCIDGLILEEWEPDDGDAGWRNVRHVPYPDDTMALFIKMIQQASFLRPDEVSRWITSLTTGDEDPILTLLSLRLPNITTMTLKEDVGTGIDYFLQTIRRIAMAEKVTFLTHLTTVNIVCNRQEHGAIGRECLESFAALPLLQSIHVSHMRETSPLEPDSYKIREITFTNSDLGSKFLCQLLDNMQGFKKFSYEKPDESCDFKPFWIRLALLASAKHTLEFLKILPPKTWHDPPKRHTRWTGRQNMGTLRAFTALKELDTHVDVLEYFPDNVAATYDKLVDSLPASLEKLSLEFGTKPILSNIPDLIEHIVREVKSKRIPYLKSLKLRIKSTASIEGSVITEDEKTWMDGKCREVGIELALFVCMDANVEHVSHICSFGKLE